MSTCYLCSYEVWFNCKKKDVAADYNRGSRKRKWKWIRLIVIYICICWFSPVRQSFQSISMSQWEMEKTLYLEAIFFQTNFLNWILIRNVVFFSSYFLRKGWGRCLSQWSWFNLADTPVVSCSVGVTHATNCGGDAWQMLILHSLPLYARTVIGLNPITSFPPKLFVCVCRKKSTWTSLFNGIFPPHSTYCIPPSSIVLMSLSHPQLEEQTVMEIISHRLK